MVQLPMLLLACMHFQMTTLPFQHATCRAVCYDLADTPPHIRPRHIHHLMPIVPGSHHVSVQHLIAWAPEDAPHI